MAAGMGLALLATGAYFERADLRRALGRVAMTGALILLPLSANHALTMLNCVSVPLTPTAIAALDGGYSVASVSGSISAIVGSAQAQAIPVLLLASDPFFVCFAGRYVRVCMCEKHLHYCVPASPTPAAPVLLATLAVIAPQRRCPCSRSRSTSSPFPSWCWAGSAATTGSCGSSGSVTLESCKERARCCVASACFAPSRATPLRPGRTSQRVCRRRRRRQD